MFRGDRKKLFIKHIQRGRLYPFNHIFRCFHFEFSDIKDIEDWCSNNTSGRWYRSASVHSFGFYEPYFFDIFLDESDDAFLFKLIWC